MLLYVLSSRRRHTRCALVTGVQTCALPILDQEKFSVYVANSRWTQTFRSIPDIRLLIKIIGWVFKTGQKSMPIFGKSVYCWYKSQITIKRLRKKIGRAHV